MKIKSVPVGRVKTGPEDGLNDGEFIVYPSTFIREPDSYGDVVAKGAFVDALGQWKESGHVMPGMYLHDPNQIVAAAIDQGEDDHGWWVKGVFDKDEHSQRVYHWLKTGRLSALSFGYQTLEEAEVKLDNGKTVNELRKVHPLEFSFLPKGFAANPDTSVVAVKALADSVKQGAELTDELVSALRDVSSAIDSVLSEVDDQDDDGDEVQDEASDEESSKVKSSVSSLAAKLKLDAALFGAK